MDLRPCVGSGRVAPVTGFSGTYMQEQEPRMQSAIDSDDDDDIALPSLRARARRRRRGAQQAAAATGGEAEECDSEPPSPTQAASDDKSADEKTVVTGRGKAKKEAVYRFYELLDLHAVRELLAEPLLEPGYKHLLDCMRREVIEHGGYCVDYHYGKGTKSGRAYATTGMQNAPAALRRLALPAYCKEVDINNSVPVFLLWLAESLAEDPAPLAALRELVENREECLRKTAEILGMSRDGAKEALLKRLRNSVAYAISKLKPHFRKIWDFCVKRRKLGWDHVRRINYKNTDGAFVHFVTTRYEALVMSRAMAFFRDRGCETICLRHDSLVIEDRQNVVDEATLRELAEFCVAIDYGETETRPQGRRDLARLAKLARLSWKCSAMVAQDGDREKLLEEEDKGSPAEQNGFENGGIYKTQEDIYQNEFMHPISFDKFRYQLVNAVTGLGKSHASRQAILQLLRANPEARVCIVTGRRTQASCVDGDLGSFLRENDIEATTLAN
eukprot:g53908.t1